jgi:hypothetical protein
LYQPSPAFHKISSVSSSRVSSSVSQKPHTTRKFPLAPPSSQIQHLITEARSTSSIFYTRREVATRIAILYTGNILATAFAGLIAIGIFKMDGVAGLAGWRLLFILQGIATFIVAVCGTHFLPDDPIRHEMAHTRRACACK